MHLNRVFHYKPSILGYHYFWKHPYLSKFHWLGDLRVFCWMFVGFCWFWGVDGENLLKHQKPGATCRNKDPIIWQVLQLGFSPVLLGSLVCELPKGWPHDITFPGAFRRGEGEVLVQLWTIFPCKKIFPFQIQFGNHLWENWINIFKTYMMNVVPGSCQHYHLAIGACWRGVVGICWDVSEFWHEFLRWRLFAQ